MKLFFNFLFLLCLIAPAASAQNMLRARQTVDTLSSPYFHGRGYIQDGDARAAEYLLNRFKQMGLKPVGNSYFQNFSFPVNRIIETPQLEVNGLKLTAGKDFVARASSPSGSGNAKLLLLDSLTLTDIAATKQLFSQSFKHHVLVYRQQDMKLLSQFPEPYQHKLQQAKLHIVLQPKTLLSTVALQQETTPVLEVMEGAWPANATEVKYSIKAAINPQHEAKNVTAFIEGHTEPDSFLVFSAHYDHLGGQGKDVYFPGANDNASGTTMLLELADYYSQPENKPKYSIAFIAFAAEEAGLLGSFYFVQNPLFPLRYVKFLTNLDLLGTGDEGMMVVNGKLHEPEFELLSNINEKHQYLSQIKSRGKAANSDHYPFSEIGVPAFFFYTLGGTAAYHNIQDFSHQLPLTKFPEVFKLIIDFADQLQK